MTKKEEYELANNINEFKLTNDILSVKDINYVYKLGSYGGFTDGTKIGEPKWHKIANGDYPPCSTNNYSIDVLTDRDDVSYYDYDTDCWFARPSFAQIDSPISWCEIPNI